MRKYIRVGELFTIYSLLLATSVFSAETTFKVGKIKIIGNKAFSDKKIKSIMKTKEGKEYDDFQADLDKRAIISFYKKNGFEGVQITKFIREIRSYEKKIIDYTIEIEEGSRVKVDYIEIRGNTVFDTETLKKLTGIKIRDILLDNKLFMAKYAISTFYANKGYIYAKVTHEILPITKYDVGVQFQIYEGKQVRFGDILLEGCEKVRQRIIEREITFKKGEIYSPKKLHETQAGIYSTGLFESVKFISIGTEEQKETLDIKFILKERKPRWVAFGGGYAYSAFPLWINGSWGHDNILNYGQKLKLTLEASLNPFNLKNYHKENIKLLHSEPYLLGTRFKAGVNIFHKREKGMYQDSLIYEMVKTGVDGKIGRLFGNFWQSFLTYRYEIIEGEGAVPDSGGILNSALLNVSYDTRDDIFFPKQGSVLTTSFGYAGGLLKGDYTFKKIRIDGSNFHTLLKLTIGMRLKLGVIFGETDIPEEERFILGGVNTIRGFSDMAFEAVPDWGKFIGVFNFELRLPITKTIEFAYFVDAGGVFKEKFEKEKLNIGAGCGFRYRTPIGPIRIDYGHRMFNLTPRDKGMVYLRIGYPF